MCVHACVYWVGLFVYGVVWFGFGGVGGFLFGIFSNLVLGFFLVGFFDDDGFWGFFGGLVFWVLFVVVV